MVARRPRLRDRRRRTAARGDAADPGADRQLAAQPDRDGGLRAPSSRAIAELAVDADLLVITDEVYEHLVFDGRRHLPLAELSRHGRADDHHLQRGQDVQLHRLEDRMGLRRQLNSSPVCGRPSSISAMWAARRSSPRWPRRWTPRRRGWPRCASRCRPGAIGWRSALDEIGFAVHDSFGTYFLCADPRPLGYDDSTAFCAELPEKVGRGRDPDVGVLRPGEPSTPTQWNHLVRFAFCKRDDTLDEAIRRLGVLRR